MVTEFTDGGCNPVGPLCSETGGSGGGARGGNDVAPPAFVGDSGGEGGGGAAASGDDWEIVGNTEQPAQTVATAERPAAVTGRLHLRGVT